jgi:DNA-directed RNA polymerase specialized sigma24 family protein
MADRDTVATKLHDAMEHRKAARVMYQRAVTLAKNEGWANTDIARACGVSEAAIRRYWKRISASDYYPE